MPESFCDHCIEESEWPEDWPHWSTCPKCVADGHTGDNGKRSSKCPVCDKRFSDKMAEIRASIDERVIREGLICVKDGGHATLIAGNHYKVRSLGTTGKGWDLVHWVRVIDDSGDEAEYPSGLFCSIGSEQ